MSEPLPIPTHDVPALAEGRQGRGRSWKSGRWLVAGAVLALLVAGGLLWARDGEAVFAAFVLTALSWCM